MATDNTAMTSAGNPNADPSYASTYYATADIFNTYGSPDMVLATVNPSKRVARSLNGENFCAEGGEALWMNAVDAVYARRDGLITY